MIRSILLAATAMGLLAGPAFAFQCPADIAAINAALKGANISAGDKAKVIKLRDRGAALHKAGDHSASVKTLAEAKRLLGAEESSRY